MKVLPLALIPLLLCTPAARAQQPAALPFEFHGLIQVWAVGDDSLSTFRVRRAELQATGPIRENLHWRVQIDPAKTNVSSILQDALLTYRLAPAFSIDAGQFKMPVGREGIQSSATLETIERGLLASGRNKFGDIRGAGAQVRWMLPRDVQLTTGVFSTLADHVNRADANHDKAILARLVVPVAKSISLGTTAGVMAGAGSDSAGGNRFGADALAIFGRTTFKAEYLAGEDGRSARAGYYALIAHRLSKHFEVAARYDVWDPGDVEERDYVAGVNYLIEGNGAKLQLNYLHKAFEGDVESQNVFVINMQAAW